MSCFQYILDIWVDCLTHSSVCYSVHLSYLFGHRATILYYHFYSSKRWSFSYYNLDLKSDETFSQSVFWFFFSPHSECVCVYPSLPLKECVKQTFVTEAKISSRWQCSKCQRRQNWWSFEDTVENQVFSVASNNSKMRHFSQC